jgi:hypothetical protein
MRRSEMRTLVYDIEVMKGPDEVEGGWSNPEGMGFGTAVVYDYEEDLYHFFGPSEADKLRDFLSTSLVVSFNGIKFDNAVLLGNDYLKRRSESGFTPIWEDFDILVEVVKAKYGVNTVSAAEAKVGADEVHDGTIGLNALAKATIGLEKTGHGSKAPQMIREGRLSEVFSYNLNDVRLTRMLYDFIQKYGYLIDGNGDQYLISGGEE